MSVPSSELQEIDYAPCHPDLGNEFVRAYLLRGEHMVTVAAFEVDSVLWRSPAETAAWAMADPEVFSAPLCHLLRRASVRRALGLPA